MVTKNLSVLCVVAAALLLSAVSVRAATITWSSATDHAAPTVSFTATDGLTDGIFHSAVTNGIGGTVNGVAFTQWTSFNVSMELKITYGDSSHHGAWAGAGDALWMGSPHEHGYERYSDGTPTICC